MQRRKLSLRGRIKLCYKLSSGGLWSSSDSSLELLRHFENTPNVFIFHSAANFSVELDLTGTVRIFTPLFPQIH